MYLFLDLYAKYILRDEVAIILYFFYKNKNISYQYEIENRFMNTTMSYSKTLPQ